MTTDNNLPDTERALAGRLREEALKARPEFSESLHARVQAAVREARLEHEEARRQARPRTIALRWALAAAVAAGLLVAAAIGWHVVRGPRVGPSPQDLAQDDRPVPDRPYPPPEALDPVAEGLAAADAARGAMVLLDQWAEETMVARPWADLDHDARLALNLLVERIPLDAIASLAAVENRKDG
jgi:hypothetical protein